MLQPSSSQDGYVVGRRGYVLNSGNCNWKGQ
jgi:hypothetical protein